MSFSIKSSLAIFSVLVALAGCTRASNPTDNKIDSYLSQAEKASDNDSAMDLLSSAFDAAESGNSSDKENKAIKLKVAKAYVRLGSRCESTGEFASARTMYERAATLESETTAKPTEETEGGHHIRGLKHQSENDQSSQTAKQGQFDQGVKKEVEVGKASDRKLEALMADLAKKENGTDTEIYHEALMRLGSIYTDSGRLQAALSLYKTDTDRLETKIKGDFSEQMDPADAAHLGDDLNGQAQCLYSLKQYEQGDLVAKRLVHLDHARNDIPLRIKGTHLALLASFREALKKYDATKLRLDIPSYFPSPLPQDIPIVADNLFWLGSDFMIRGNYQDSLDTFNKLQNFTDYEKINRDNFVRMFGLRARDEIRLFLDRKAIADEAEYLRRTESSKDQSARALMAFDWAYDYLQRTPPSLSTAKSHFLQAGELFKRLTDKLSAQNYERCLLETAQVCVRQNNFPEAASYLNQARKCSEPYQPTHMLAEITETKGNYPEALVLYQKAAAIAAKATGKDGIDWTITELKLVHLLILMKRYDEGLRVATEVWNTDLKGYEKQVSQQRCETRLLQGELAVQMGRRAEADKYLGSAKEILDRLELLELSEDNFNLGVQMANVYEIARDRANYQRVTAELLDEAVRLKRVDLQNQVNEMRAHHTPS